MASVTEAPGQTEPPPATERPKPESTLVIEALGQAIAAKNADGIMEFFADDAIWENPVRDLRNKYLIKMTFNSLPGDPVVIEFLDIEVGEIA